MRCDVGNADAERADLRASWGIELYGSAYRESGRISVGSERKRIVTVRVQGDRVRRDLGASVIADRHWNVHLSHRYRVHRYAGGRPTGVVESDDITAGIAALQRDHRFLVVMAENHKTAD